MHWVTGMCTDMTTLLAAVFALPTAKASDPLDDYRQAYVAYYTAIAHAAQIGVDDASGATPPNVPNGAKIHEIFFRYLTGLADISGQGATLLASETTAADVAADITEINKEIKDLSNGDYGIDNISSPELEAAIKGDAACQKMVSEG